MRREVLLHSGHSMPPFENSNFGSSFLDRIPHCRQRCDRIILENEALCLREIAKLYTIITKEAVPDTEIFISAQELIFSYGSDDEVYNLYYLLNNHGKYLLILEQLIVLAKNS